MPIYEYECVKCGATMEAMQKFSDAPLTECCHCKGEVRKLISMSTFHLKGSGWYTTDYSGKNQSTCANSKTTAESSGPAKSDKPAASTPASDK